MPAAHSPLLSMRDVHTFYGRVPALQGVSFDIPEGEIIALIGANGAGKTTVLRTISGLLRPARGEILHRGERIDALNPGAIVRRGIAHCPEERRIWSAMTVEENLDLGAYTRSDRREIAETVEQVYSQFPRLKERRHQLAGTLSGGEQQMLALGRALMSRPTLLLLDEPTLGLSPALSQELAAHIRSINRQGTTVVLVEQNAFVALSLATRAYVLEVGRVVAEDDPDKLRDRPELMKAYLGG